MKTLARVIDAGYINLPQKRWCATLSTFILLTVICSSAHTHNILLRFYCNNGYENAP